jgi:hypothetical protein
VFLLYHNNYAGSYISNILENVWISVIWIREVLLGLRQWLIYYTYII